ncbi:Clp protease N-terminal domain-containing protein [Actinomycetospora aeridis]|uniref:Clp protease N-terminal domain-containing protein n=1 Tax=Actinomycetospora aeridis TaxID=3129231 RepID=A0ABU8NDV0_9PSEU
MAPRSFIDDARRWSGWRRAAAHAAAGGRERAGTEHLLLSLVEGPPGPAQRLLAETGVVIGTVRRALEAIMGPDSAPLEPVDPALICPGTRAHAVLLRASNLAGRSGSPATERPLEDVHLLAALISDDDPSLALLILEQLGALRRLRRLVLEYDGALRWPAE